jgi:ribosomal protein S18 acetylase RimI-like enzyme
VDRRIQDYVRSAAATGRRVERIGPFLATFDPHDADPNLSYAIPDAGARPQPGDVAALVAAYTARERTPRLEFLPAVAPEAEAALLRGGFTVQARLPVMTCAPADAIALPPPEGIVLGPPASREDVRGVLAAQAAAFGAAEPDDAAVDRALRGGALRVMARDAASGLVVGGGVATTPLDDTSEIAGIAVLEGYRRRGIAGAMTAWLAGALFAAGVSTAFLTPGDEGAQRMYARAGFADTTEIVHLIA